LGTKRIFFFDCKTRGAGGGRTEDEQAVEDEEGATEGVDEDVDKHEGATEEVNDERDETEGVNEDVETEDDVDGDVVVNATVIDDEEKDEEFNGAAEVAPVVGIVVAIEGA